MYISSSHSYNHQAQSTQIDRKFAKSLVTSINFDRRNKLLLMGVSFLRNGPSPLKTPKNHANGRSDQEIYFLLIGPNSLSASVNPHIHHCAYHTLSAESDLFLGGADRGGGDVGVAAEPELDRSSDAIDLLDFRLSLELVLLLLVLRGPFVFDDFRFLGSLSSGIAGAKKIESFPVPRPPPSGP
mmetsp:Transcript_46/g.78  ORF Transcript_46/g.78 Transcript_46/m.78 type:complete len:184 (+) Transcript_46:736-1287(+)